MKTTTGNDIALAASLLEEKEVVAIPTETVYGLAANALEEEAVVKIFKVKNRPYFDPLIIHIPSFGEAGKYAVNIPDTAKKLASRFSPGPLTFILPRKEIIPDLVTSGHPTVGIRVPNHPLALELLRQLNFPLAAPSANPFGYVSPTTAGHVFDQLEGKISYILDGGPCKIGLESTIIAFENDIPVILRLGGLSIEEIEAVAGKVKFNLNLSSNPLSPGQLQSHYAPGKKLIIGNPGKYEKDTGNIAVISFSRAYENFPAGNQFILSPEGNLEEAARNLFKALRVLDKMDIELIIAEKFPDAGLGRAINDRLMRAAAKNE